MGIPRIVQICQRKSLMPLRLDVQIERQRIYLFYATQFSTSFQEQRLPCQSPCTRSAPPLFIAVVEEELYSNCSRTLILSQVVKTGHTLMSGGKTQTENEQASPLKITYEQKKKRRRSNFTDCF